MARVSETHWGLLSPKDQLEPLSILWSLAIFGGPALDPSPSLFAPVFLIIREFIGQMGTEVLSVVRRVVWLRIVAAEIKVVGLQKGLVRVFLELVIWHFPKVGPGFCREILPLVSKFKMMRCF